MEFKGPCCRSKLRHLEKGNELRRSHAAHYNAALQNIDDIVLPFCPADVTPVYHIYAIRIQNRDEVMGTLGHEGIGSGVHYPIPIHRQEAYRGLGYGPGSFPIAEKCAAEFVSLPMFPELTSEQLDYVAQGVTQAVNSGVVA